ncbi:type I-B CRISPR-associated protein Cas5b [Candidatus Harpocratesius sp.]
MTEKKQNLPQEELLQNIIQYKDCFIPQKVLIFDLIGKMAHFRNLQTNSTSLSYHFPPPTTIHGILAAILGLERDSYYEIFKYQNTFIGLQILTPLRKELFTLNYLKYTLGGYTQIPVEIILPLNDDEFRYRIYFSHFDKEIYENLKKLLQNHQAVYPPSLGLSEMLADFEFIGEGTLEKIQLDHEIEINSVFRSDRYEIITKPENFKIFPEYMRYFFESGRIPGPMMTYFYLSGGSLRIKVNRENQFFKILFNSNQQSVICRL